MGLGCKFSFVNTWLRSVTGICRGTGNWELPRGAAATSYNNNPPHPDETGGEDPTHEANPEAAGEATDEAGSTDDQPAQPDHSSDEDNSMGEED